MITAKQLAKQFIAKGCSPALQQRLRQFHAIYQIRHNRHFREPEMTLIKSLVAKGDVAADVGANVGVYTAELSLAVGAQGKVFSFEPAKENYDILTMLVGKAGLDNVTPFRFALGSSSTQCEIVIPEMDGFTGYYWVHVARPEDQGRREVVKMVTLDELHKSLAIDHLDFVKCDVEGAELQVLQGGLETIRLHKPGFLMEVSRDTSEGVFKILHDLGYEAFVFDGRLIRTEKYKDREYSNYFFLHPSSACWQRALSHFS